MWIPLRLRIKDPQMVKVWRRLQAFAKSRVKTILFSKESRMLVGKYTYSGLRVYMAQMVCAIYSTVPGPSKVPQKTGHDHTKTGTCTHFPRCFETPEVFNTILMHDCACIVFASIPFRMPSRVPFRWIMETGWALNLGPPT